MYLVLYLLLTGLLEEGRFYFEMTRTLSRLSRQNTPHTSHIVC